MHQDLFFKTKMKKLLQKEVEDIFNSQNCVLKGLYVCSSKPIKYVCFCGIESEISLDRFKKKIKSDKICSHTHVWTEQEDEIIRKNYGIIPREDILNLLSGVTYNQLKNRAYALGLKGNRKLVSQKIIKNKDFNECYFDVIDINRSYWAGYIAGMGSISKPRNRLILKGNISVLERFAKDCELNLDKINIDRINLYGVEKWIYNLEKNYNLKPSNSVNLEASIELDENNSLSYIKGYILGRGDLINNELRIVGSNDVLCWIKVWFERISPAVQRRFAVIKPYKRGLYRYILTGARKDYIIRYLNEKS